MQLTKRVIAVLVVTCALTGLSQSTSHAAKPGATFGTQPQVYAYQLWVRDTAGIEFDGEWHLWNTYTEYGNAIFVEHGFNQYGYDTEIERVNPYWFGGPRYWFLR